MEMHRNCCFSFIKHEKYKLRKAINLHWHRFNKNLFNVMEFYMKLYHFPEFLLMEIQFHGNKL